MSADNGIYILQSKDGWRVIEAQAIDNLWWDDYYKEIRTVLNPDMLLEYFGKCEVLKTKEEAMILATELYEEIMNSDFPICEYGISFIYGWEDEEFPKEKGV